MAMLHKSNKTIEGNQDYAKGASLLMCLYMLFNKKKIFQGLPILLALKQV